MEGTHTVKAPNGGAGDMMVRPGSARRVLIHVQHLLGVGHLRRAIGLGRGLAEMGAEVTLVSGGMPVQNLVESGLNFVQLPAVRTADATYRHLLDERGVPVDDAWRARRKAALLEVFETVEPAVVVIELYPFGRRQLRFELDPLLDAARARAERPWVACSLRDIIQPPAPDRVDGILAAVRQHFDMVLVHGDPSLAPLELSFSEASRIADRLQYTGYLLDEPSPDAGAANSEAEVLVSGGGGAVGAPLLKAALAARPLTRHRDRPWRLLAGYNLAEDEFQALKREAAAGVVVERARTDFTRLLPGALCSISQAGYNTAVEVLAARVPAVFVPFAGGRQVEQLLRCRALSGRGLRRWVEPHALTPASLAAAINRAESPKGLSVDMGGRQKSAELLLREEPVAKSL